MIAATATIANKFPRKFLMIYCDNFVFKNNFCIFSRFNFLAAIKWRRYQCFGHWHRNLIRSFGRLSQFYSRIFYDFNLDTQTSNDFSISRLCFSQLPTLKTFFSPFLATKLTCPRDVDERLLLSVSSRRWFTSKLIKAPIHHFFRDQIRSIHGGSTKIRVRLMIATELKVVLKQIIHFWVHFFFDISILFRLYLTSVHFFQPIFRIYEDFTLSCTSSCFDIGSPVFLNIGINFCVRWPLTNTGIALVSCICPKQ